jgi:2-polyprenyl-6-methoxyphenol hydroxylase-like FAD-dependent oxidoreductase
MPSTASDSILIIGGGIGGLAAAVALRRIGLAAEVYERAPEIREVGAGLSLWSNAMKALRWLGLEDAVRARSSPIENTTTRTDRGDLIAETPVGDMSSRAGAQSVCAHRADLQQILASALDSRQIHLNATCTGFASNGDGVIAQFADGQMAQGSLLIGADGIRSAVRDQLHGAAVPRYAGYFAYRGVAKGRFALLPPQHGVFILGRGAQIGAMHCGPERVYWFATVNAPVNTPTPEPAILKSEILRRFVGWCEPIPTIIAATEPAAILKGDIIDRPPAWPWGSGRVTLLGDAIHPTTPNLGQGACMALEDAVVLANSLAEYGPTPSGLRAYEVARRERTAMVTNRSYALGQMFQLENRLLIPLRNWLFRRRFGQRQGDRVFDKLLSWTPPAAAGR